MKHSTLRREIEKPHPTKFWGQDCICDPRLVSTIFGDGRQLFRYAPIDTRPNYYIIRVGSDWTEDSYRVHEEDILQAIEHDFSNADNGQYDQETGATLPDGEWERLEWPALHDGGGEYNFVHWTERTISKRRARKLIKRGEQDVGRIRGTNQYRWLPMAFGQPQAGTGEYV
ncbi:hypothetical protein ACYPKM_02305 [Pseudomonas aeruginosa]